jgi:hypothetical protein
MKKVKLKEGGLGLDIKKTPGQGLAGRFIMPPFSVLRSDTGEWQTRRQQWIDLGIRGELPTDGGFLATIKDVKSFAAKRMLAIGWQSVFDPVLCELMYAWFCTDGGQIVDPFAGGSVRGIVANYMGYQYWGSEIREKQVEDNRAQAQQIVPNSIPTWVIGDSNIRLQEAPMADFIFSCPPYGNLEVYSEEEGDLSSLPDEEFDEGYKRIIKRCCAKLKDNRFACFVVSNYRNKEGFYRDLVGLTVQSFEACNVHFYNEAVLINSTGTLCLRAGRWFVSTRKLGRHHQNVLIFYKGNIGKIRENFKSE